jgi:hypothetical protein
MRDTGYSNANRRTDLTSLHRCGGDPAEGGSECLVAPAGAVVCFGYLDTSGSGSAVALRVAMDLEPQPILLPVCAAHRRAMIRWAADNWSHIAPGMWVEGQDGINEALRQLEADGGWQRTYISPDPAWAVRVEAV